VDDDLEVVAPPSAELYEGSAVEQKGLPRDLAGGGQHALVDEHAGGSNALVNYSLVADGT
jgi:hypothetical protein